MRPAARRLSSDDIERGEAEERHAADARLERRSLPKSQPGERQEDEDNRGDRQAGPPDALGDERKRRLAQHPLETRRGLFPRGRVLVLKLVHLLSERRADDNGGFVTGRQSWP